MFERKKICLVLMESAVTSRQKKKGVGWGMRRKEKRKEMVFKLLYMEM